MAATGISGIDVRNVASRLLFRVFLVDALQSLVSSGNVTLSLFELQDDGTLKTFDFNDNTFKTTTVTTYSVAMTNRTANNGVQPTGIWTYALTTVSGFTNGAIYFAQVYSEQAANHYQTREFQYAGSIPANVLQSQDKSVTPSGVVATGATGTSIPTSSITPSGASLDQFIGRSLYFDNNTTTSALRGVVCYITASTNAANPTFTVEMSNGGALPTSPASGDTFVLG